VWEDLQSLAPWVALAAALVMGAVVERMRRVFVSKDELRQETEHRKIADGHIDERAMQHAQTLHNYMGKLDLLRDQVIDRDRERDRELAALREEVRIGFAKILARLDKYEPQRGE
jgi:hypothetical protein